MLATWNSRYNTGIQAIDDQHQELFRLVDLLRRMVQEGSPRPEIEGVLAELLACTQRHFATEEAFMARTSYPDFNQHLAEHASMLASLHELLAKFRESQEAMALMVPTFMEGWLKHHISDGDFGFVSYLKARNLA